MSDDKRFVPGGVLGRPTRPVVVLPGELIPAAYFAAAAIVRDLAAGSVEVREGYMYCTLCDGATERTSEHEPACPWRRACEWVAAHPEGAAQQGSEP